MAIALRGTPTAANFGSSSSAALTNPTGIVTGDLICATVVIDSTGSTISPPAGWTAFATGVEGGTGRIYWQGWKKSAGTEGTTSTFTFGATATGGGKGTVFAFSGVDATTQIEQYSRTPYASATTPFVAPSGTPTAANCWHIAAFEENAGVGTLVNTQSGYTVISVDPFSGGSAQYLFSKLLGSSGVASGTASNALSPAGYGQAFSFIVRATAPPPAGGGWKKFLFASGAFSAPNLSGLTVSWTLPLTDSAGNAIGTILSQKIYYDTVSRYPGDVSNYAHSLNLASGTATSQLVVGLASGTTYYFSTTATSASGESSFSPEVSAVAP